MKISVLQQMHRFGKATNGQLPRSIKTNLKKSLNRTILSFNIKTEFSGGTIHFFLS
jgi:hypothetical protein